jgi:hypothetical protein
MSTVVQFKERAFSKSCWVIYWTWANQAAIDRHPHLKAEPFVGVLSASTSEKTIENVIKFEYYRGMNEIVDMQYVLSRGHQPYIAMRSGGSIDLGHNPFVEAMLSKNVKLSTAECKCRELNWLNYKKSIKKRYIQHECGQARRIELVNDF